MPPSRQNAKRTLIAHDGAPSSVDRVRASQQKVASTPTDQASNKKNTTSRPDEMKLRAKVARARKGAAIIVSFQEKKAE
jgi:hypothetical protein